MKIKILFLISILVIGGLFLSKAIIAQDLETADEEIAADEDVVAEDLGVSEPRILPDRPLYFIKNIWREVRMTFTFSKVKKAELRLHYANQRLIEAKAMAGKPGKEERFQQVLKNYQGEIEKLKAQVGKFKAKAEDSPKIDKFLDKYTDRTAKHQRLMDHLEKQLSDEPVVLGKIKEAKERALEHFGEVIEQLEEKDKIPERLEKNLEKIEGSIFKNFKNLGVLLELEEKVPEQAKEAIQQAQQNALKRLQGDLEKMSSEDQEKFGEYVEGVGGAQATHLRILEKLEERELLPALERKIEQNREKVQERVQAIEKDALQLRERIQEGVKEQTQEEVKEQAREQVCIAVWDPVCGQDGKTYSNACFAKLSGVRVAHKGKCGCAKAGEKVNRNPLLGSINRECCPGLKEVRVSKSYSICEKEIKCEVSITCKQGYASSDTGKIDDQGCPIMECVPPENSNNGSIPEHQLNR